MTYACLFPLTVLVFTRCARPTNALHSPSYYGGISVVRIPYVFRLQFNATARRMRSISNIFAL